ncbi:hypothetical protein DNU06_00235 [Putridiphycobacter roseus]|uniref:Alpha-1,2-fucosyltransferase n=1 Tax=Putridiphycobacter roseus TaxID=2219161 RepID=A0A2W1NU56_9FLAO|nr:alpha-1,2-fucosyltransferase [Putridiphycobacter roseus]PZE18298.1 hypothetical protein DNU06_00235 [Putridiphycobacter roseus]
MIFLKISGGLGNQMFQFATATALAIKNSTKVAVDLSLFNKKDSKEFTSRPFDLATFFNIGDTQIVDQKAYSYLFENSFIAKIKRKLRKGSAFFEPNLLFQPAVKQLTANSYLEGYFQSEKYFKEYREQVLNLFEFKKTPSAQTKAAVATFKNKNSIAIHIRRGDYVSKKHINAIHGALPLSYYKDALKKFDLNTHHLVFFSDDMQWVKENFTMSDQSKVTFVDWNTGADSWQDMYLMTQCKNFIIANSSFSWWGAWLAQHAAKQVYCPKTWFNDPKLNQNTKDLIPAEWFRI